MLNYRNISPTLRCGKVLGFSYHLRALNRPDHATALELLVDDLLGEGHANEHLIPTGSQHPIFYSSCNLIPAAAPYCATFSPVPHFFLVLKQMEEELPQKSQSTIIIRLGLTTTKMSPHTSRVLPT
jgi:hypothetical protein